MGNEGVSAVAWSKPDRRDFCSGGGHVAGSVWGHVAKACPSPLWESSAVRVAGLRHIRMIV